MLKLTIDIVKSTIISEKSPSAERLLFNEHL